ncbi:MAG: hypothetical protein NPIRA02_05750 [Nitrospirales bacterium]|nr:MAG: hypothetical protein NPIRA02_05750 [Nitrospirales bacterium]
MKTHTLILGLVACAVLSGNGVVFAQESESGFQERGSGKLKKMDADRDGNISLDEYLAMAEHRFGQMDANTDGYVTADELKNGRKAVRAKSRERRGKRQAGKIQNKAVDGEMP